MPLDAIDQWNESEGINFNYVTSEQLSQSPTKDFKT